jgi:hypothetical protein
MAIVYLHLDGNADPRPSGGRNNERTFGGLAEHLGRQVGASIHSFSTGREVLQHLARYERIERLIIFAHGGPSKIGWLRGGGISSTQRAGGWKNVTQMAEVLAPRLAPNTIIGLAACTCGITPSDWRRSKELLRERNEAVRTGARNRVSLNLEYNRLSQFASSGVGSIAYNMRDAMLNGGAQGVEVRAHLWAGPATTNPHCISFRPPARSPGILLADSFVSTSNNERLTWNWMQEFRRHWTGERAQEWILGGPSPENVTPPSSMAASDMANSISVTSTGLGTVGSVIPNQRPAGSFENTEAAVESTDTSIDIASGEIPRNEEIQPLLVSWADVIQAQLNRDGA